MSKAIDKAAGAERGKIAQGSPVKRMIPGANQKAKGSWIKDDGREYQPGIELPATDAAKEWQGWGTALKPAWEPIIMARKPIERTVAQNVQKWATGGINIDACRIELNGDYKCGANGRPSQTGLGDNYDPTKANQHSPVCRWPANLILDQEAAAMLDEQIGGARRASRFFYTVKASKSDRGESNSHPTVKPQAIMRYLVQLVTIGGGIVLSERSRYASSIPTSSMAGLNRRSTALKSAEQRMYSS